ncbi:MAG: 16S rRNA (adenine(1518)-N(6)/adenine(1519)-N(6))-dimethyltransferase RsmA [Candidatus Hadarchaeales archaeon]
MDISEILSEVGWLRKSSGQHLLLDQVLLERIVGYGEITKDDIVLEIGTGVGNLTELLSREAGKVISIEKDPKLLEIARRQLQKRKNVVLVRGDALRVDFPEFTKVVSNLPYGISSPLTFKLLERDFRLGVLMYQKEFAERMIARPGTEAYSRLTVGVHYRADVEILEEVPPAAFFPQPKVTSVVVRVKPRKPPFKVSDEKMFFSVVKALFQHRRQLVKNSLFHSFEQVFPGRRFQKTEKKEIIDKIIPKELAERRVMDLPPEAFARIAELLKEFRFSP